MSHSDEDEAPLIPKEPKEPLSRGQAAYEYGKEQLINLDPRKWRRSTYFVVAFVSILIGAFIMMLLLKDKYFDVLNYTKAHQNAAIPLGVLIIFLGTVTVFPGTLLWLGAGYAFQPYHLALFITIVGSACGMAGAFLLGRYLFRDFVRREMQEHTDWMAINSVLKRDKNAWKVVILLRMTGLPYHLGNFLFGVTTIKFSQYLWPSVVGSLHYMIFLTYLGSLARNIDDIKSGKTGIPVWAIILLVVVFACIIYGLFRYAREELKREMAEQNAIEAQEREREPVL